MGEDLQFFGSFLLESPFLNRNTNLRKGLSAGAENIIETWCFLVL
jgi:hypothetical protein